MEWGQKTFLNYKDLYQLICLTPAEWGGGGGVVVPGGSELAGDLRGFLIVAS